MTVLRGFEGDRPRASGVSQALQRRDSAGRLVTRRACRAVRAPVPPRGVFRAALAERTRRDAGAGWCGRSAEAGASGAKAPRPACPINASSPEGNAVVGAAEEPTGGRARRERRGANAVANEVAS